MRSFLVISCALSALWICASAASVVESGETVAVQSIVEDKDDDTVVVEGKQQIRREQELWRNNRLETCWTLHFIYFNAVSGQPAVSPQHQIWTEDTAGGWDMLSSTII